MIDHTNPGEILRALMTNPHLSLGDLVYTVRDNELKGWDGPAVKAWSDAVVAAEKWLKANPPPAKSSDNIEPEEHTYA